MESTTTYKSARVDGHLVQQGSEYDVNVSLHQVALHEFIPLDEQSQKALG